MTSITKYKSQWEREAVEKAEKQIAEWLHRYGQQLIKAQRTVLEYAAGAIERGEYKSELEG